MRTLPLSLLLAAAATPLLTSCGSSHLMSASNAGGGSGSNPAKTTPTLTWAQPAAIAAGTALGPTQLDATANVAGTFAYSPAAGTVPAAGTQTLSVMFTPADAANYTTATASVKLVVNTKQNPKIVWAQPAPITIGAALSADQLNAQSDVAGTFAYSPAAGTVLEQGMQTLSVTFTPADAADYNAATATVPISVNAADNPGGLGSDCASGSASAGAYLYVSTGAFQKGPNQVQGFSIAADGSLTPVSGSPFTTPGLYPLGMTGTGTTLFGADGLSLYSLAIHSGGCLTLQNSMAFGSPATPSHPFDPPMNLFLDPAASTLYAFNFIPEEDAYYTSYRFDASTGQLSQTGATQNMLDNGGMLAFDASGRYAVTSSCYFRSGPAVSEYQRKSDGTLAFLSTGPLPTAPANSYYCTSGAAADHSGHFVVAVVPCQGDAFCQQVGPEQLAVYTLDASGNLTTSSTAQSMPTTVAKPGGEGSWFAFSADDRYFSIAGYVGLDVYAWDSAKGALTHIATINNPLGSCSSSNGQTACSGTPFGNLAWDSNDHLYTFLGNQLFVYTVTASGVTQAPGSPHAVQNPQWVTVVNTGELK